MSFWKNIFSVKNLKGNIGTASVFKSAYNQFKSFREGEDLEFHDLTPTYLLTYESWLLSKGEYA
ncbi:MAG: phage integrase SAM-like domain-containing protein [Bacteroidetes bacterium]|nr:phage integrase SAM-like domain-containing protein [Bacteroidota bacterium]